VCQEKLFRTLRLRVPSTLPRTCFAGEPPDARLFSLHEHRRAGFLCCGCDPILSIGGSFFPSWMVAILIGSLTVAIRYLFVFTGLEPHVGPLALIYTSLGLLLSVVSGLILYQS
jgi:hypothetical protein